MTSAALERASSETFVSSRDADVRAMVEQIEARERERLSYLPALLAATDHAVADPSQPVAADTEPVDTQLDRTDDGFMEHERQRRLANWQRIGSQR